MTSTLSTGLEKTRRFRKKSGLNEHLERHKNVTGPHLRRGRRLRVKMDQHGSTLSRRTVSEPILP
jgi:hypothetical protein